MVKGYCVKCREKKDMNNNKETKLKNGSPAFYGNCPLCKTKMFVIGDLAAAKKKERTADGWTITGLKELNAKEKKAFVARMKKGKKDAKKNGGGKKIKDKARRIKRSEQKWESKDLEKQPQKNITI